ncbi:MAG TPA: polyribonucleotide nucleotidyltransferase [Candidatus Limnocylindria bacterium]|jgi:polyribonucleotide nucleotidyltransferase|nr:polyribonucleotide nucleotidyltransferase [Candidatus Limnocylindria bacterium]
MAVTRSQAVINGKPLVFETGKLAEQAGGAVTVRYGDTLVLAAATVSPTTRPGIDFFPLTIDFEERLYAAGKIPGSFPRREGRPSEEGILTARLTDRPIRPLFPKAFRNDVQVVVTPLSADQENEPDILAVNAASAALAISPAPFEGPIAAVRVGTVDGKLTLMPTIQELEKSEIDLVVAGTRDAIMMVEAGANQVSEDLMMEALKLAQTAIVAIIDAQEALVAAAGKPKMAWTPEKVDHDKKERIAAFLADKIRAKVRNPDKAQREQGLEELKRETIAALVAEAAAPGGDDITESDVGLVFDEVLKTELRRAILEEGIRPDGRGLKDIRPLHIEVGVLPRTHGSALFARGQTQVLSITTLGPSGDEQIIDTLSPVESKRFMHHYNFPPYSVGEVRPLRGAGRREIGHGALAERALLPLIPSKEEFPYTIRVVSETLSSNGSTSMAATCGATLSLMDAGVPIKAMIGGISIGLVTGEGGQYKLLTDIQGMEDNYGDMDFKVTGSEKGITAIQLDIKVRGLSTQIFGDALQQAREGRLFILNAMRDVLDRPRPELSRWAPRIETIKIQPDKVREVIGPGGKMVRAIQAETGTTIELEDDGTVRITGAKAEGREKARAMIEGLTKEPEVGEIYDGKVTRIMSIGAFVEYLPGKEGLVRVSEITPERVNRVEDVVNVGDKVKVKVAEVDRMGRVNLSMRAVTEDGNDYETRQRAERERYRERDERGGGPRRGPGGGGGFRRGGPPRG